MRKEDDKIIQRLKKLEDGQSYAFSKIALPTLQGYYFVEIRKILRCRSYNNYTYIHLLDGEEFLSSKTLKTFDTLLGDFYFFRINRSDLINLNYVKCYFRHKKPSVTLIDDTNLSISLRRKQLFLKKLLDFTCR